MTKSTTFIALAVACTIVLAALLAVAVVAGPAPDDHLGNIRETLVGMNLTYYSIAGKPLNYTIGAGDIGAVEQVQFEGRPAWKVRVGQGLQWDLTMDEEGKRILDTKQLFVT